jgi:hypothetical protein
MAAMFAFILNISYGRMYQRIALREIKKIRGPSKEK